MEYLQRMSSTSIGSRDPRRSRKTRKTKRRGQRTGRKQRERYIARKHDCRSSYPNKSSLFKTEFCYSESIISIGEARLSLQLDEVARLSPLPSPPPPLWERREKNILSNNLSSVGNTSTAVDIRVSLFSFNRPRRLNILRGKATISSGGGDFYLNKETIDETFNPNLLDIHTNYLWRIYIYISSHLFVAFGRNIIDYFRMFRFAIACHTTEPHSDRVIEQSPKKVVVLVNN